MWGLPASGGQGWVMRQLAAEPKVRKVFGAGSLVCRARL